MNKKMLEFFDALRGKTDSRDIESYKVALAEGIIGFLKDNDFIVKANKLVIGCESGNYEEALEESKPVILKYLKNQGGVMRRLADRIDGIDNFQVKIAPAPKDMTVKMIPAGILPTEVWFFLDKILETDTHLVISRNDWCASLAPHKRYTIGRSAESRDASTMLTIPNASMSISRWQAELVNKDGIWYCKSISNNCPTFVDERYAEGDMFIPLLNLKKGGQIKFGMSTPGFVLKYKTENN